MESKVTNVNLVNEDVNLPCLDYYIVKLSKNSRPDTQVLFGSVSKHQCIDYMNNYVLNYEIPLDFTLYLVQKSTTIIKSIHTQLNEQ